MSAPVGAAPERIWLAVEAVDMRLGIDGLSARIQASLGRSPCDGTAYAFTNRRRSRLKLLIWDGTGVWLSQRRLHRGYFTWPSASDCSSSPPTRFSAQNSSSGEGEKGASSPAKSMTNYTRKMLRKAWK